MVDDEQAPVFGVSELVEFLTAALDDAFSDLWVEGEVGSLHRSRAGHLYFDLKDATAQLRAVIFRGNAAQLGFQPEEGMQVRAHASLGVYAERGLLQLVVDELRPAGEGALRVAFERLKTRLHAEGLFDPAHKRALPLIPRRIGLVTSLKGAAVHDFLRGLGRRFPAADVLACDARVQGEGAWREIVRGLHLLDANPDVEVIVLARGGGSLEDLWTFNQEEVVRCIFELETPLVSAIGHEVDLVLSDLVADVRAATPTAAAELVVPEAAVLEHSLAMLQQRLIRLECSRLRELSQQLEALRRGLVDPATKLRHARQRLEQSQVRLFRGVANARERLSARLEALGAALDALSPLAVLGRGYSIARRDADGALLRSSTQVEPGEGIGVRLLSGALCARVTETMETS